MALLLCVISMAARPFEIRDADVFWHLASGRWIFAHGIPRVDPFSCTALDRPWVDHEWLFQVLLRATQLGGGAVLMFFLKGILYTSAFVLLAWSALRRELPAPAVLFAVIFCLFAAIPFSEYRPLMLSICFLALTLILCTRLADGARAPLYLLPILFCVWANVHATFMIGLLALMAFAIFDILNASKLWRWGMVLALCMLATCINPYGPRVWAVPWKVAGSQLFMSANQEWRPPDASAEFWGAYVLAAALLLVAWQRALWSPQLLFALLLGILVCRSRRIIPYFAIASVLPLAAGIDALLVRVRIRTSYLVSFLVLLLALGVAWASKLVWLNETTIRTSDGLAFLDGAFPNSCAETLKRAAPGGNVFNDYNHGGYLHYTVGPNWKVFVDGRNELFGDSITMAYNEAALAHGNWRDILVQYKVSAVLASYDMAINETNIALELSSNSANWLLADFDDAGMLFFRRSDLPAEAQTRLEMHEVRPMLLYEEQADFARRDRKFDQFISELRARCERSRSRIAEQTYVRALIDIGQRDVAAKQLDREVQLFGNDAMADELRSLLHR